MRHSFQFCMEASRRSIPSPGRHFQFAENAVSVGRHSGEAYCRSKIRTNSAPPVQKIFESPTGVSRYPALLDHCILSQWGRKIECYGWLRQEIPV